MKFAKVMSGAVVAFAALAALGATASAAPANDMGVLTWRVVAGPYPGNPDGAAECQIAGVEYKADTGAPVGCLLDADSNQYFLWANI
jgi:hypothetical protein